MQKRLDALRNKFRSLGVANFMVTQIESFKQSNIRYLCGYTGSNGLLFVTRRNAYFLTDGRYANQVKREVTVAEIFICKGQFIEEMKKRKEIAVRGRVGIEKDAMTVNYFNSMQETFPKCELVPTKYVIEQISAVKDDEELAKIKHAVEITDRVFDDLLGLVEPGMTEREVAAEIASRHLKYGAEKDSFDTIVASGERSALPHGIASTKKLERGDFVTFDFGCFYEGYASDMTRTVVLGKASSEQRKIYNLVLDTQNRAAEAVQPGKRCSEVDALARRIITDSGYGDRFTHGLGHGLGHIVHARPVLSARSREVLQPGNVVTVEPGIYIEGFGGVRIEDDVVVTEDGNEILNNSPKELIEL